jgi:hypothetical protein
MGNRCLIVPKGQENLGVYLHWNGGVDSVTAFLTYCKMKEYRPFGGKNADGYGIARLCQVVGNYFGGALSIGIEAITEELTEDYADAYDNGIYVIDGWEICKRISPSGNEGYDLLEMLIDIDKAQPTEEQLGEDYLRAEEVEVADLEIGDRVYVMDYNGKVEQYTIQGFADNSNLPDFNRPLIGSPYINKYNEVNGKINPNNFLTGKVRRVKAE